MMDTSEQDKDLQEIWNNSVSFTRFWRSYFKFLLHPHEHMRVLNFAYKVIIKYNIKILQGDNE
jgi:hypothetical protein